MSTFIDTNIVCRVVQPSHSLHEMALQAVKFLTASGQDAVLTPQGLAEFWNVATRPEIHNGVGFTHSEALLELLWIEQLCSILAETAEVYAEWKRLVTKHLVSGVKVHDARLVAAMNVYGIKQILTFNTADFARYDIETISS